MDDIEGRVRVLERDVLKLDHCVNGNGKPGLKEEMRTMVDKLKRESEAKISQISSHGKKNMQQGDQDVLYQLEIVRKTTEENRKEDKAEANKKHEDNQKVMEKLIKKVDNQGRFNTLLLGALIAFKALEDLGWLHIGVK